MRKLIACAILTAVSLCGCASQELDKELMNIRQQAAANEKLYAAASMKYADAFQTLADQKHEFQSYLIEVEGDQWVAQHTKDGLVQATPEDFDAMLAKRDERLKTLASSQSAVTEALANFRQMINDKVAFSTAIYDREVDAQEAKESFAASVDSVVKALGGIAGAAAVAIPLALP